MRLNYSAKYENGKVTTYTSKNAGAISNAVGDKLIANMNIWSGGKYTAARSIVKNLITVKNIVPAATKGIGSDEVNEMQRIVNNNIN
ncbi:hypothetical protein BofuT4_uP126360.1 [Botrytis cinerea T4]|uniref:Uncharacterized protein n=1 Tax=Botryotinia fuckeliana (strain T4) TaxID=999810 RepID=G2YSJ0_BOTF4|nr:hypothetical protein BofuT4_uP126360.1 [Botrytis cinerea T4]